MSTPVLESISTLPAYTPSAVVPSYSPEPGLDERLIERAPHSKSRTPAGNYIQKSGRDIVVLADQEENAEAPSYGRHGHINGFVSVESREAVSKVVLTLKGKIDVAIVEGGSLSKTVLDQHFVLWPAQQYGSSTCPSTVPFSTVLPATFAHENATYPLPPSYGASFITSGGVDVKVSYTLSVVVTRTRKLNFMSAKNTTSVRFTYAPRTRPGRPIQPAISDFFTDIKVMPEEWRQTTTMLAPKPKPKSALAPVHLHLFIPAAEIFALGDTIPFHVQLTGPVESLRAFLPTDAQKGPGIRVSLLRQLLAGHTGSIRFTAAHGTLASAPPGANASTSDVHNASLDWSGEILCRNDIQVGTFDAGVLKAQDFIVVDVFPSAGSSSPFARARHAHPIRIVTDSWPDT
ncbi:hypothetical protein FB451DRAFT_1227118 [Mycena latifolia]|nr:hypothetical protein FB451DRAFT_1227118 [Mycena latifolia]